MAPQEKETPVRRVWPSLLLVVAGCLPEGSVVPPPPAETITLLSHDSFVGAVTDDTFSAFAEETGVSVKVLAGGDAGAMLNQAILTKDNPIADVLFGVDDTFLGRALDEELFLDFVPERATSLDPRLPVPAGAIPIDYGDVCLNYDKSAFDESLPPPATLETLIDPAYRGMLVVENPATSSPGLAFLLATIDRFGEPGWKDYWTGLVANDVEVTAGWDQAYYGSFSGGAGEGDRPLVVSYASSPPAEVIFSDPRLADAPTGVITDGCYRQVEFAGVLMGTKYPLEAGRLIDFMLSPAFQSTIPSTWFVYPAVTNVTLPAEFVEFSETPSAPITMDPGLIEENRNRWIEEWTAVVLP